MKKIFYLFLTIIFIFFWTIFVDIKEVLILYSNVNWLWVLVAVLMGIVQAFLASNKLRLLFSPLKKLSFLYVLALSYLGAFASLILHFSGGGFLMTYLLGKKLKTSYSTVFSIILVDFLIGVLINFIIAFLGIYFFISKDTYASNFRNILILFIAILAISIIFSVYLTRSLDKFRKGILILINSKNVLLKAFLISIVVQGLGLLSFYLYFKAFEITPPVLSFIFASAIFYLLNLIPGIPAKLGQHELIGLITFPALLNIKAEIILSVVLLSHVIGITLIIAEGLIATYYLNFSFDFLYKILKKMPRNVRKN